MRAAVLHAPDQPFLIEQVDVPEPGEGEVLVHVAAAGLIPNMRAVVSGKEWYTLPPLPSVYGLDAAGVIVATGSAVDGFTSGDRVYVNPVMHCGTCPPCARGDILLCDSFTLRGYFSTGPKGDMLQRRYPIGAFAEYVVAPQESLVRLSEKVTFAQAARFGYLGTAYHALKTAGVQVGTSVVISGTTGTLGVASVQLSRAMGASSIIGLGRNPTVLASVEALDPSRVTTISSDEGSLTQRILELTDGIGADGMIDCQGRGASIETTQAAVEGLRKGGRAVMVGAVEGALSLGYVWLFMTGKIATGSMWFTTDEGAEMVSLVDEGALDLSVWQTRAFPLESINEGLQTAASRLGGFVNPVVSPSADLLVE